MVTLISVFGCALLILLIYALMPMLKMKDAITTINKFLEGDEADVQDTPPLPLKEQIDAVVSRSERTSLEQIFMICWQVSFPYHLHGCLKIWKVPLGLC